MKRFIYTFIISCGFPLIAGTIEGDIQSNETVSGQVYVGLFQPGVDQNYWVNRSAERDLGYIDFPESTPPHYNFDETWITDGDGWHVVAFVDQNSNAEPDPSEVQGMIGPFSVSGGYYNTGLIYMA
ncbi:MAG: hypothetical protein QF743_07170, partial [Candidatus Marinimicrobia bacterium]|nr:hypothetical protein [Candidatus Neomarinimicrobiota bacterium]